MAGKDRVKVPPVPAEEATMMPPATTPTVGEARRHDEGHGYGLVLFASVLLAVVGCFNLIRHRRDRELPCLCGISST